MLERPGFLSNYCLQTTHTLSARSILYILSSTAKSTIISPKMKLSIMVIVLAAVAEGVTAFNCNLRQLYCGEHLLDLGIFTLVKSYDQDI